MLGVERREGKLAALYLCDGKALKLWVSPGRGCKLME